MPQISLYVDKKTMRRITDSAKRERKSVSSWVRDHVMREPRSSWPAGYFENVIGCLKDSDLEVPKRPDPRLDAKREPL